MKRSLEPELMDSPDVQGEILRRFHKDLAKVHFLLGTHSTILRFLRKDKLPLRRVLDIGCGDGHLLEYIRRRTGADVVGVDLKPLSHPSIPIHAANAVSDTLPDADVAICSLLNHHLSPDENVALIRNAGRSCKRLLILDLIRHPLPLVLFTLFICPLLGREAAADGRQSIRRAYTPEEWKKMAADALGIAGGTVKMDVSPFLSRQIIDVRYR